MDVDEAARLKEGVGGMGQGVADARNSPYQVGPRPQVQPLTQALHALPLLAEGVLALAVVTLAQPQDLLCFQLHFLQHECLLVHFNIGIQQPRGMSDSRWCDCSCSYE